MESLWAPGVDPDSGDALDPGPTPPAIQAEVAARAMGPGEDGG
jgi:hypothetical protein